jgi:hypothetical protein
MDDKMRERIDRDFTHHPPKDDQLARYTSIRAHAKVLAECIAESTPSSREQSVALTKLDEVVMFANAAIVRNE